MSDRQQQAEHAHILEVYAERVERRYTPVKVVADDNKRFAAALRAGASALAREQEMQKLLIRADRLLSLLWHRHVPSDCKDSYLSRDVEQTIGDLRRESKVPHD